MFKGILVKKDSSERNSEINFVKEIFVDIIIKYLRKAQAKNLAKPIHPFNHDHPFLFRRSSLAANRILIVPGVCEFARKKKNKKRIPKQSKQMISTKVS